MLELDGRILGIFVEGSLHSGCSVDSGDVTVHA